MTRRARQTRQTERQASNIARQMYPNKIKAFNHVFENATKDPYSYLFIDLKTDTPEQLRLLSHIWNSPINVYLI